MTGIGAKIKLKLKLKCDNFSFYIYNSANITINSQLFRGPAGTPTGGWEPLEDSDNHVI